MLETRTIRTYGSPNGNYWEIKNYEISMDYIEDLSSFGWKIQTNIGKYDGYYDEDMVSIIIVRDKKIPNYDRICELEDEYEYARSCIKDYHEANGFIAFLLLLMFIIPGIIYIAVKHGQKRTYPILNEPYIERMNKAMKEADRLLP